VQVKWGEASAIFCNKTPLFGGTARAEIGESRVQIGQPLRRRDSITLSAALLLPPRSSTISARGVSRCRRSVLRDAGRSVMGRQSDLLSRPKRERCERNQAADSGFCLSCRRKSHVGMFATRPLNQPCRAPCYADSRRGFFPPETSSITLLDLRASVHRQRRRSRAADAEFEDGRDFDWDDLGQLLRRTIVVDRYRITRDCVRGLGFLAELTDDEQVLANDQHQRERAVADRLRAAPAET
jgi:hypothetical protein